MTELEDLASVAEETSSWPYQHDRDLTGFIDGTENPSLIDAPDVALIPEGLPARTTSFLQRRAFGGCTPSRRDAPPALALSTISSNEAS